MTHGKLLLWITKDDETYGYVLTPLTSEIGGVGYRLGKASADGCTEEYDVLLHGRETSCTCPGHTYRSKCKHVDALLALISAGKLPAPKKPEPEPQPAKSQPWCEYCNDDPNAYCHRCSI
jgi:hypothetical protein